MSQPVPPQRLSDTKWLDVIRHTPLVSIDLVLRNAAGEALLGLRNNEPARNTWFVPGGAIKKNETLDAAFARISLSEIGIELSRADARLLGVYEHHYATNFANVPGVPTHYVVIGYELMLEDFTLQPADEQHRQMALMLPEELLARDDVHENTKAYFRS